jgi:peptide/nickel transport system substrate-binding protein
VTLLSTAALATLDPQRISDPTIAALTGRTLHRTLTAYAPTADGATQATVVGDLATDTGKPSEDLKTWRFTLRDDATWQDGSAVTCEDVKHGVARTFACHSALPGRSLDLSRSLCHDAGVRGRASSLRPGRVV